MKPIMRSLVVIVALTLLITAGLMAAQTNEDDSICPLPADLWLFSGTEWPVNGLQLGIQFYTQDEVMILRDLPASDDASLTLALQLTAAKLNIANGSDPLIIRDLLLESDRLLAEYTTRLPYDIGLEGETARLMLDNASVLEFYNSRQLTPTCVMLNIPAPLATEEITVPEPAATEEVNLQPVTTPEIAPPVSTPEVRADDDGGDDDGSGQGRGRGRGRGGDDSNDDDDD